MSRLKIPRARKSGKAGMSVSKKYYIGMFVGYMRRTVTCLMQVNCT